MCTLECQYCMNVFVLPSECDECKSLGLQGFYCTQYRPCTGGSCYRKVNGGGDGREGAAAAPSDSSTGRLSSANASSPTRDVASNADVGLNPFASEFTLHQPGAPAGAVALSRRVTPHGVPQHHPAVAAASGYSQQQIMQFPQHMQHTQPATQQGLRNAYAYSVPLMYHHQMPLQPGAQLMYEVPVGCAPSFQNDRGFLDINAAPFAVGSDPQMQMVS